MFEKITNLRRFWLLTILCSVILIFRLLGPFGFIPNPSSIDNDNNNTFLGFKTSFNLSNNNNNNKNNPDNNNNDDDNESDIKYILIWTPDSDNVRLLGWSYPELDGFKNAGCPEHRCFLTNNKSYLGSRLVGIIGKVQRKL